MDNAMAAFPGAVWYYGNVYDPADGGCYAAELVEQLYQPDINIRKP